MEQRPKFIMGALGDSITTAFNAHLPNDNFDISWATGSHQSYSSHRKLLQQVFPNLEIEAHNYAFSGARASDLDQQVSRLLIHKPDYVTLLIGANDLYHWLFNAYEPMLQQFRNAVETSVQRLVEAMPRILILLVGVPDQSRLLHLTLANQQLQNNVPFATMLQSLGPTGITMMMALYRERWQQLHNALDAIAESYKAHVKVSHGPRHFKFEEKHLSTVDFYHPGPLGQSQLAALTWQQGWFPGVGWSSHPTSVLEDKLAAVGES